MRFKDKYYDDFNAILLSKGERLKPEKEWIEYGKVPGSSKALYQDTETFQPYDRTIEIMSQDPAQLSEMYQWLDGSGQLEIDEGGYYNARVKSVTKQTVNIRTGLDRLTVIFELQPYLFLPSSTITLTSGQSIWNPGIESDPYLKITGSGSVVLTVNGVAYTVTVDQYVEIEFPFAWKSVLNRGRYLSGFPKLQPGNNVISWTGTVTKVLLNGRWRTL